MLNIFYGDMDCAVSYGPSWFKYGYDPAWFQDPFVQDMILDIDNSTYRAGLVIESPVLGQIPPERLSGGVQTLISIYKNPEIIFDATSCGPNCAKWLLKIGQMEDVTVNLNYFMPFEAVDDFAVNILNENRVITDYRDFTLTSLKYL